MKAETIVVNVRLVYRPWWFRFTRVGRQAKWATVEVLRKQRGDA